MNDSQLLVFTHKYLGLQHLIESHNVDKIEFGSDVPLIYTPKKKKKNQGTKLSVS